MWFYIYFKLSFVVLFQSKSCFNKSERFLNEKDIYGSFSFVLLGLAFMFGNVSVKSFEEIGSVGGELVLGRLVVTDFIQNDFFVMDFYNFLCVVFMFFYFFL